MITLKSDKDEQKASIADIDKNPKDFKFVAMEAAQLPRSLDSIAAALFLVTMHMQQSLILNMH